MPSPTPRKVRLPAALGPDRAWRRSDCLDSARQERRERLDALRTAARTPRR